MKISKIRILIVDDHVIIRDGIRALLALYNDIEVIGEAGNGEEAIDRVCQLKPDMVLMDISMPGVTGIEATRHIHKEYPGVKVLVLTQYEDREFIYSAIDAGASGFITKTAAATELVSAIRAVYRGDSYLYPPIARVFVEDRQKYVEKHGTTNTYEQLTDREKDILRLAAGGYTNKEIAEKLSISVKTVEGHKASLMDKLDIRNQTELVKFALRKGIIA